MSTFDEDQVTEIRFMRRHHCTSLRRGIDNTQYAPCPHVQRTPLKNLLHEKYWQRQADQQRVDSSTPLINSIWGGMRNTGSMNSSNDSNENNASQEEVGSRIGQLGAGGGLIQAGSLEAEIPAARRNVRMNVMDDGVRGMNASRLGLLLLTLVNLPLIIAGVVVLALHWTDDDVCESGHRQKWRWWALLSVVRMVLITPVVVVSCYQLI